MGKFFLQILDAALKKPGIARKTLSKFLLVLKKKNDLLVHKKFVSHAINESIPVFAIVTGEIKFLLQNLLKLCRGSDFFEVDANHFMLIGMSVRRAHQGEDE